MQLDTVIINGRRNIIGGPDATPGRYAESWNIVIQPLPTANQLVVASIWLSAFEWFSTETLPSVDVFIEGYRKRNPDNTATGEITGGIGAGLATLVDSGVFEIMFSAVPRNARGTANWQICVYS